MLRWDTKGAVLNQEPLLNTMAAEPGAIHFAQESPFSLLHRITPVLDPTVSLMYFIFGEIVLVLSGK